MNEEGTGQEPTNVEGQEPEAKTFDAEYVKKLRAENADWRTKAQEAAGKVAEFEAAKLTEAEKLQKEAAEAKTQLEQLKAEARQARADAAIAQHAAASGLDVDLAKKLVDVQFDDKGQPTGVEAAITNLLTKHPHLKTGFGGSSTNPQRQGMLTAEVVKKMTPQEYAALSPERRAEALKAIAQG